MPAPSVANAAADGRPGRLVWMLDLFEDLERREREAATTGGLDQSAALASEASV
jgi:hypothetical protein